MSSSSTTRRRGGPAAVNRPGVEGLCLPGDPPEHAREDDLVERPDPVPVGKPGEAERIEHLETLILASLGIADPYADHPGLD